MSEIQTVPRPSRDLKVLHKSKNFIVVDKDPDVIINSEDETRVSLHRQLAVTFPDLINKSLRFGFYFPHRLDFSTSGVICIALTKRSCAAASLAFQRKLSKKYYLALLRGHVSERWIELNLPIGETIEKGLKLMTAAGKEVQPACSRLLVLERGMYNSYPATKVLLRALTGRRHQLRLHCHTIGHTIIGDYTYSQKKDTAPPRMYLHAFRLIIPNEVENIDVSTEDPFTEYNTPGWMPVEQFQKLDKEAMDLLDLDFHNTGKT